MRKKKQLGRDYPSTFIWVNSQVNIVDTPIHKPYDKVTKRHLGQAENATSSTFTRAKQ